MIPQELYLARKILKEVLDLGYGPDGKSQVTLDSEGNIVKLVISVQHKENQDIKPVKALANKYCKDNVVNGTGKFVLAGFAADAGVTGRKIVNDAYGPQVPVGGGAFSGKDPSKVDRSAAYMARRVAIDLLRQENAKEVEVKIAYSIGIAEPLMAEARIKYESQDSDYDNHTKIVQLDKESLTPSNIIKTLDLKKPIYRKTAEWGAFGNNFGWE
jgi:S-adenosylmethionine synthetase